MLPRSADATTGADAKARVVSVMNAIAVVNIVARAEDVAAQVNAEVRADPVAEDVVVAPAIVDAAEAT